MSLELAPSMSSLEAVANSKDYPSHIQDPGWCLGNIPYSFAMAPQGWEQGGLGGGKGGGRDEPMTHLKEKEVASGRARQSRAKALESQYCGSPVLALGIPRR